MAKALGHSFFPPQAGLGLVLSLFLFGCLASVVPSVAAQYLVNGQVFTDGLAILDAPAPGSVQHAGSSLSIAIDVTGDGKLLNNRSPAFESSTFFDSIQLYLYSTQTNFNFTVESDGAAFLRLQPGSSVQHLNFPIPKCIEPGEYNFTIYENFHFNGSPFFSITPIPLSIENNVNKDGSQCNEGINPLLDLPQPSSPPPQPPLLDPSPTPPDFPPTSQPTDPSSNSGVARSSDTSRPSSTRQARPTATVTVVVTDIETIVTTLPGRTIGFTTVITSSVTIAQTASILPPSSDSNGFRPVNGALSLSSSPMLAAITTVFVILLCSVHI